MIEKYYLLKFIVTVYNSYIIDKLKLKALKKNWKKIENKLKIKNWNLEKTRFKILNKI